MTAAGLKVIPWNEQEFDLSLEIELKGQALSGKYGIDRAPMYEYYTGARVSAVMRMKGMNGRIDSRKFSGNVPLQDKLSNYAHGPSEAPFHTAFSEWNLEKDLGELLLQGVGPGTASRYWVHLLHDRWTRKMAHDSLRMITGQDFGLDPDAWQQWWDAQPKGPSAH